MRYHSFEIYTLWKNYMLKIAIIMTRGVVKLQQIEEIVSKNIE